MGRFKILFIAGWYPNAANPLSCLFVKEHAQMLAADHEVVVLYSEGIDPALKKLVVIEDNLEDGLRTLRLRYRKLPLPRSSQLLYFYGMFAATRKLYREGFRPDLIHANIFLASLISILIGKWYRLPVIITEHASNFYDKKIRWIELLQARYAFRRAALVCPVSESLKRDLENSGIQARFQVVPNVVDTDTFKPQETPGHAVSEKKHLLFVAHLVPSKGLSYLLEALKILTDQRNDFVLDVIGGNDRSEYEQFVQANGLGDKVVFHGGLPKEAVAKFMRTCDFFVLPTLHETFGVVLIEALASGKPVIASNIRGPAEIVDERLGLLVPPADRVALARAINHMLDHHQEYDAVFLRRHVLERYSREVLAQKWQEIYQSVLNVF